MNCASDIVIEINRASRTCLQQVHIALNRYVEEIYWLWDQRDPGYRLVALLMIGLAIICSLGVVYVLIFLLPLLLFAALLLNLCRTLREHAQSRGVPK